MFFKFGQLAKIFSPSKEISEENFTSFKEVHPSKADSPIFVTDGGISTFINDEQLLKALLSIDETKGGIIISFKEEHLKKALSQIRVTFEGIFISIKEEQQLNKWLSITSNWHKNVTFFNE